MSAIFDYMKNTKPEIAKDVNTKSTRNMIREEAREYAQYLKRVKETAQLLSYENTVKSIDADILFLCRWMVKFGVKDEE